MATSFIKVIGIIKYPAHMNVQVEGEVKVPEVMKAVLRVIYTLRPGWRVGPKT